jgi:hypothetical protein
MTIIDFRTKSSEATQLAKRLLSDRSTGDLSHDFERAFSNLMEVADERALFEEWDAESVTAPHAAIRVLIDAYGANIVSTWVEIIGKEMTNGDAA